MARKAFIWGSNGSKEIGELKYARDDARRIAKTLSSSRYNFAVTSPTLPDDPYQIKKELDLLATSCAEEDSLVIFFSGHGELLKGELMLVLDGTKPDDLMTYLPVNWVKEARDRSAARNRLIILDCCHAGGAVGAKSGAKPGIDLEEFGLESKTELMLLASRRLEIAREFEYLKGSFLTTAMSNFLETTTVTTPNIRHLMSHLNISANMHNSRADNTTPKVPIPFLHGEQQGDFYFTEPPSRWVRHQIDGPNATKLLVIPAYYEDRAWCLGETPVTNAQYRIFIEKSRERVASPTGDVYYKIGGKRDWVPQITMGEDIEGWVGPFKPWEHKEFNAPDQPVVCVSFAEAQTYAKWLGSQSEILSRFSVTPLKVWDIAAFGKDFQVHDRREWRQARIHDQAYNPAPVTDADDRATLYGAFDMLGNVWEWCSFEIMYRGEKIANSEAREIRGGSYLNNLLETLPFYPVSSLPDRANCRHSDLGFRVAAMVPMHNLPSDVAERVHQGFDVSPLTLSAEPPFEIGMRL
jgi:hypothetical protein